MKRCKECGGVSFTGVYCLNCDENFWRFAWRRGWAQIMIFAISALVLGAITIFFYPIVGAILLAFSVLGSIGALIYGTTIGVKRCFDDEH